MSGEGDEVPFWVFLGMLLFAWWAVRDSYRTGRAQGRLDEKTERLERQAALQAAERGEHLRVVK